jgi:FdhE protein
MVSAGTRWAALATSRPDLQPAIGVQQRLVSLIVDLLDTLEHGNVPRLSLPPRYLAAKLARGVPAIAAEPIPVPLPVLVPALLGICAVLSEGGAGEAADHVGDVLRDGSMDPASLLTASLARDQQAIRSGAEHRGLSPDLLWLVAELAVSPFAYALQQAVIVPAADPTLAGALDRWTPGFCPACGSWPALAEVLSSRMVLRCSFCAFAWTLPAGACTYCGERHPACRMLVPDEQRGDRRVQVCDGCRSYLKAVVVSGLSPFPLLAIADLETMDLDVVAMEGGYRRPELKEFAPAR